MKTRILTTVAVLVLIGGLVAVGALWRAGRRQPPAEVGGIAEAGETGRGAASGTASEPIVHLSDEQMKQFDVQTGVAGPGRIRVELVLPGEVALNADRVAHVVPRVTGVVREVRMNLGDTVRGGEVMAILESRELADATAAVLAARERVVLARSNFTREEQLWQKKISPEQDYIQARNSLAEASIEQRTAEQKLRALGFSDEYIAQLPSRSDRDVIIYQIAAPFAGTVIEKHINLGEVLKDDTAAFVLADLSSVWVNLDVQQKDLPLVRVGQMAEIGAGSGAPEVRGRVSFVEPIAYETNRTTHARVVIANSDGRWRPGLFVTGRLAIDDLEVPVLVSNDALLMVGGKMCVFVQVPDGFRLRPVSPGRNDGTHTEISGGLAPGEVYVTKGAITLKSELEKPETEP